MIPCIIANNDREDNIECKEVDAQDGSECDTDVAFSEFSSTWEWVYSVIDNCVVLIYFRYHLLQLAAFYCAVVVCYVYSFFVL